MTAITAHALTKRFGGRDVLDRVDLSIAPGSIYGLLGRNGAGKTTLLKLATGLLRPTAGEVRLLGDDPGEGPAAAAHAVGYVAEQGALPGWMTVGQVVRFERSFRRRFDASRVDAHVRRSGLAPGARIQSLSKGQRRRLELELALAADPGVLLLDEPFDGLDPVMRAEAMEEVVALVARADAAVLVSSHVMSDLERLADRIGVLAGGRLAFEADLDDLKESVSLLFGPADASRHPLPAAAEVIASRTGRGGEQIHLVKGLGPDEETALRGQGVQLTRPGLDELGLELLRCLSPEEENS
ncbi:MAG TPA: ABC transporter ATP-binding protein [Kofleriaceae bacterium]|nr:ABC transporter ATP-binding protein [Kofleriaceae bacterium]